MKKIKGKGIFLERGEFKIHRNNELGWDFWDPDFQVVLRSAGDCAHFFPQAIRPDGKDGGVLFSLGEGASERLGRSRKLLRKRLPKHEVDLFIKAMETLKETVCTDPVKQRTYDMIRLPDPAVHPVFHAVGEDFPALLHPFRNDSAVRPGPPGDPDFFQ